MLKYQTEQVKNLRHLRIGNRRPKGKPNLRDPKNICVTKNQSA